MSPHLSDSFAKILVILIIRIVEKLDNIIKLKNNRMKYISALMMVIATISNISAMKLKTVAETKFDFDNAGVGSGQS